MKNNLITRYYDTTFESREENNVAIITGHPIVFNSRADLGFFDEIIDAGALDTTNLNDVRLCLNHDTSYVYARSRRNNANSTMKIDVVFDGLTFEAALAINDSPKARDYYSAVKRGDMDKMSFMFSVDEEEWENLESDHPTRHIKKIGSVIEISAVTFPAYEQTTISARSKEALENAKSELESARAAKRSKSVETDEINLIKEKIKML